MTEIKLLCTVGRDKIQVALDEGLRDGWFPQYESFQLNSNEDYEEFAILVTRP